MTSFCFFVQLADRTLILKQKEFFVFIIATRLLWNHSPSEWFSLYKKASGGRSAGGFAVMKSGAGYPTMKYRTMSAHSRYMIGWISLALPRTSLTSTCTMMPAPRPLVMLPVKAVNIIMTHGPMDSS